MDTKQIVELDVREDLKLNRDPFQKIMGAVTALREGQTFVLHASFKPVPLLKVMGSKGFDNEAEKLDDKHWKVTFTKKVGE